MGLLALSQLNARAAQRYSIFSSKLLQNQKLLKRTFQQITIHVNITELAGKLMQNEENVALLLDLETYNDNSVVLQYFKIISTGYHPHVKLIVALSSGGAFVENRFYRKFYQM